MSATSYGWLVLAFPLAGTLIISLAWRLLPGRTAGWIGTAMIGLSFLASIGMVVKLLDLPVDAPAGHVLALRLRERRRARTSSSTSWSTRCRSTCA